VTVTDPYLSELDIIRAEQELEALIHSSMSRDFERRGELDYPERLQEDDVASFRMWAVVFCAGIGTTVALVGWAGSALGLW
jgi:hypothetical protein